MTREQGEPMHVRQRPNGTWEAIVQHHGHRRKVVAKTRGEAMMRGSEALIELGGTPTLDPTCAELVAMWRTRATLSATYATDADRAIRHLPATFTNRPASTITPLVIAQLYRTLLEQGVSVHRVRRAHTVLSSAWTHAIEMELATRNPFTAARKPAAPSRKVTPPTAEHVAAVVATLHDDPQFALYVTLASAVGARRGELVGLRWEDVHDDSVILRRSLSATKATGIVITEGKTGAKGHRVVAIDAELAAMLRAHRARQVAGALAAGLGAPVWVFSHTQGWRPWRPDYTSRRWRQAADSVGVTCRLHDLRHYVATQLLVAGVPLKAVSERLGHRQLATTSDVYGAYVPAADRESADVMARLRRPG